MSNLRQPPLTADLNDFVWKQWFNSVYRYVIELALTAGSVSSVTASSPLASSGGVNPNISLTGTVGVANGGTGFSSYTVGDLLYASAGATLAKLAGVATGNALISGGVATAPSWGKIGLTTHVSGTLPVANGGTGATDATTARSNLSAAGISGTPADNRVAVWTSASLIEGDANFLWNGTSLIVGQTAASNLVEVLRVDGALMATIPSAGLPSTTNTDTSTAVGMRVWTGGSWALDFGNNNGPGWIQNNTISAVAPTQGEILLNPRGGNVAVNTTTVSSSTFGSSAAYALNVSGSIWTSGIVCQGSASQFHRDVTGGGTVSSVQSSMQLGLHSTSSAQTISDGAGASLLFFGFDNASPVAKAFIGRISGVFEDNTAASVKGGVAVHVRANNADSNAGTLAARWYANTNYRVEGYTQLGGSGAPAIKMKELTGTTAGTEGGTATVAHGLTGDKIIGFSAIVRYAANSGMSHGHTFNAGYEFDVYYGSTNFVIANHATNSENILSKSFVITVWYKE